MEVSFRTTKLAKQVTSDKELCRKFGTDNAYKIRQRLNELEAAASLEDIKKLPQTRLHPLTGNREGQFSVDVKQPYRLIFTPQGEFDLKRYETVKKIEIVLLSENYH